MSRILVPACGVDDWRKLLADPLRHWKRGFSAYETAHRWQSARSLPHELAAILGVEAELLAAIPEHQVAMPGHGRNSQCDVFALVRVGERTIAAAIEGKVDETFGPTIGAWLTNASAGKLCRLASICEMLGLAYPPNGALRYQLFHRTAAAIVEADRFGTGLGHGFMRQV